MVTVGVDLHKRVAQIAVLTPEGEVSQHRLETTTREITQFFAKLPAQTPVAVEASATWWWFIDLLEALGHRPVLSHPKQTKAIAAARLKNDRVDAARLAMLLRADLLPAVWIPPSSLREARELVRHRIRLTQLRTCLRNMLQSMLARRNLRPAEATKWMSVRGLQELAALSLPTAPSIIREDCFELLHVFDEQIRNLDIQLTQAWGEDPRVRRLTSVPGIGPFIATVLVLELGEIHRFPSAKHLASYVGLTPRIRASAERTRTGHISKEGNRLLRWVLVLAATQASRRPGPLRAWYRAVQKRRGRNAARVALARRLAEIVYQLWKTETTYDVLQTRSRAGVSPLG
jgi:transposase